MRPQSLTSASKCQRSPAGWVAKRKGPLATWLHAATLGARLGDSLDGLERVTSLQGPLASLSPHLFRRQGKATQRRLCSFSVSLPHSEWGAHVAFCLPCISPLPGFLRVWSLGRIFSAQRTNWDGISFIHSFIHSSTNVFIHSTLIGAFRTQGGVCRHKLVPPR